MIRYVIILMVFGSVSCAGPCNPRVTDAQAVALAKRALDQDAGKKVSAYYGPYTTKLEDCRWIVTGRTPPSDVSGDAQVAVAVDTGKTDVLARMRTDPKKLEKLLSKRR